jgi:hypothetical protein
VPAVVAHAARVAQRLGAVRTVAPQRRGLRVAMRAALAGDAGQKPGLGRKPDVRRLFFFGGKRFFASVGLRSVAFELDVKGKSTVSADRLCARILKPEAASWLFWDFGKSDGRVSLGRRARRRGRGNARTASVAVSRGGRRGTDRESHAPWPCSERAREPTSRLVRVTHRHAGSRDREAFGPCVSGRASERRESLSETEGNRAVEPRRKRAAAGRAGLLSRFRAREDLSRRAD